MLAKVNCASAWANHTAGRSARNGGSRTATLDISAGIALFVVLEPSWFVILVLLFVSVMQFLL
jgi:hypothetical protein